MNEEKYIPIICGKETAKVRVSDVVMVMKDKRKLRIVTDEKEYDFYQPGEGDLYDGSDDLL